MQEEGDPAQGEKEAARGARARSCPAFLGKFVRYLGSGFFALAVDYAVFFTLKLALGTPVQAAQLAARLAGAVAGFFAQRNFVFHAKAGRGETLLQGAGYTLLAVANSGISALLLGWLVSLLPEFPTLIPKLLTDCIMAAETFVLLHLVFRSRLRL